jgi:hypothetical protein
VYVCTAGDSDSSSGDEFFWDGGPDGHNMRKELLKMARDDFNVLSKVFDTVEEQQRLLEEQERLEKMAAEEAAKCPTDTAGR